MSEPKLPEIISVLIWQLRSAAYDAARGAPNDEDEIAERLKQEIVAAIEGKSE